MQPAGSTVWPFIAPPIDATLSPLDHPPTFSVIIAAYNVAPFIGAAIQSALDQTVRANEIVVCDDGSTDELDAALEPHREHITLIRQPNHGEAAAKNAAALAASGEWLVVLDGDDLFHPRRIEALQWLACVRPDLDLIGTDVELFGEGRTPIDGDRWSVANSFEPFDQRRGILDRNFLPAPAIRRSRYLAVGGFDEHVEYGPDWVCYQKMILEGSAAGLVVARLYRYRQWASQQTADVERVYRGRKQCLELIAQHPGVTVDERTDLEARIDRIEIDRWWAMVSAGHERTRHASWELARQSRRPLSVRVKAAIAAMSPRFYRQLIR